MKFLAATLLGALAVAAPVAEPEALPMSEAGDFMTRELHARQFGSTENQLVSGACRRITFIFARGSTEPGNVGATVGPAVARELRSIYGTNNVAIQGVDYAASLGTNVIGGDPDGIRETARLLNLARTKCPNTIITAGGYSQGAALLHRSVPDLPQATRNQIAGIVTFGDTFNAQDNGRIRNYPPERTRIFCNIGDLVCVGTLTVTAAHLAYVDEADDAAAFLRGRISAAGA